MPILLTVSVPSYVSLIFKLARIFKIIIEFFKIQKCQIMNLLMLMQLVWPKTMI